MKVLLHTRNNTTAWWKYIASQLRGATSSIILSERSGEGDINIMPPFYRNLGRGDGVKVAIAAFGEGTCLDIVRRCRMLRSLDPERAAAIIGAMYTTLENVVRAEKPDVFVSFMIDYYMLDVLDRILREHGINYVGMNGSVVPRQIMFTARGEYMSIREPTADEVDAAIELLVRPDFLPEYIPPPCKPSLSRFLRNYSYFTLRGWLFDLMRQLRRDPLNMRYYGSNGRHVPEYRIDLRDWQVFSRVDAAWQSSLSETPFDRRVFVGLQVNPECSTDYWVRDLRLIDYPHVLDVLISALRRDGYTVFMKDHPCMANFRQIDLIDRLKAHPNVVFVPYEVPGQYLIENCKSTFTWTGNIGLQAALAGRCAIAADGAFYVTDTDYIVVRSFEDIDTLPARITSFEAPTDITALRRRLLQRVLRACTPGEYYTSWQGFDSQKPDRVEPVRPLIESLNHYLPRFLDVMPAAGKPEGKTRTAGR